MTVIKILGLSGHSRESWSDAVQSAVVEATRLLQPLTDLNADKTAASGTLTRLDEYAATICVAFVVEDMDVHWDLKSMIDETEPVIEKIRAGVRANMRRE